MTLQTHTTRNPSPAAVLLAVAALLGALVLYQVARFVVTTAGAARAVAQAQATRGGEPNDVGGQLTQAKSVAATLKEKNLFVPPRPKVNPVQGVEGILGDEVLINGQWYKAGDKVGDAEVLAIGATTVKVSWNGQETEFTPDGSGAGGGPGGPPSDRSMRRSSRPDRPGMVAPGPRPGGPAEGPSMEMPLRPEMPQNMSPEDMQRFREQMRQRAEARRR